MDSIECEFISKSMQINDFNGRLDDEFFVNLINKSTKQLSEFLKSIKSIENNQLDKHHFTLAICSLQVFILTNWISIKEINLDLFKEIDENHLKNELQLFESDYQPPIKNQALLYLTKQILKKISNDNLCILIWKLRYLSIFQSFFDRIDDSFSDEDLVGLTIKHLESDDLNVKLRMRFLIEICQHNLVQNKVYDLKELLMKANDCTQLDIKLSGALGKRTHFQEQAKSILFLNLTRKLSEDDSIQNELIEIEKMNRNPIDIPKDMNLKDDTLLAKPVFLNEIELNQKIKLTDDEETLLLTIFKFGSKCGVNEDNLLKEELLTYIDYLISNSTVWSVKFESMFQRSVLESNERRKVERSMLQINELIDKINQNVLTGGHVKLHLFYSSLITPIWKMKKKLADLLVSLSCVKEASRIYEELNLWEEIVFCYRQDNRRHEAEAIIKKKIEFKETPYLLCLLGDVNLKLSDKIDLYEKAWQLSEGKSYLAQKRLGYHYFDLKDYHKAIECFKKSLELNSMQLSTLQRLGYSALLIEDYELAASAYRRVVESDLDNFQAWNNLSKAYIKLGDKQRASKTLEEALKINYENWKIWENYIAVCVDIGQFNGVIKAWNRLIDIKSKYEDDEIMVILVDYLCQSDDQQYSNLKNLQKHTIKLLGRMTANFQCSCTLWLSYAKLTLHLNDIEEKVFHCLTNALRALMSKTGWEKNSENVLNNLKSLDSIYDYYRKLIDKSTDLNTCKRHWTSFKLSSNSMLTLIKNKSEYWSIDEAIRESIQNYLNEFEIKFNEF